MWADWSLWGGLRVVRTLRRITEVEVGEWAHVLSCFWVVHICRHSHARDERDFITSRAVFIYFNDRSLCIGTLMYKMTANGRLC